MTVGEALAVIAGCAGGLLLAGLLERRLLDGGPARVWTDLDAEVESFLQSAQGRFERFYAERRRNGDGG